MIVFATTICMTAVAIMFTFTLQTCSNSSITCWRLAYRTLLFHFCRCSRTYSLFDTIWSWSALACVAASVIADLSTVGCTFCKHLMLFSNVRIIDFGSIDCYNWWSLRNFVYWTNLDRNFSTVTVSILSGTIFFPLISRMWRSKSPDLDGYIQCRRCVVLHSHDSSLRGGFFQVIVSVETKNSLSCIQRHLRPLHYQFHQQ